MKTVQGTTGNDAVFISNATDPSGAPVQSTVNGVVTVTGSSGVNVNSSGIGYRANEYLVNLGAGNDTLSGDNMIWMSDASTPAVKTGFGTIDMGGGDDFVFLNRSGFRVLDTGEGNDTVLMYNSGGGQVNLGGGHDRIGIGGDPDGLTEAELAQKDGYTLDVDGGTGTDTLNLYGDWTLTLQSGVATFTDGSTHSVFNNSQYVCIQALPAVLNGMMASDAGNGRTLRADFSNFEALWSVCFTNATLILTPNGEVYIEDLREGDLVVTKNGIKPLRWIGKRRLDAIDLAANPKLLPIRVPAGAFGKGLPRRSVHLSPQHRVLIRSEIAQSMFSSKEVLIPVKELIGINGIHVVGDIREVTYIHLMFDAHEILKVEGIEAESLYPGPQALKMLGEDALEELRAIFVDFDKLISGECSWAECVPFVKGRSARALAARHAKKHIPLYT